MVSYLPTSQMEDFGVSDNHVTFRGRLLENPQASSVELNHYLKDWTNNVHSLLIQGVYLELNTTCNYIITNIQDPECSEHISDVMYTPQCEGKVPCIVLYLLAFPVICTYFLHSYRYTASYHCVRNLVYRK